MQDFGSLKLLVAVLGPSSPLLGPIWSQKGPQNGPKSCPKSVQKLVQNLIAKITQHIGVLGPKIIQQMGSKIAGDIDPSLLGHPLAQDGAKMALRWLKMPKMAPRWPKIAPRWPKMPPRCPKMAPKWLQDAPR